MAIGRGRRRESYGEFWPAYVDVLSTLLMVLTLLLSIFMLAQYFVGQEVNGKDNPFRSFKGIHATVQSPQFIFTVVCRCHPNQFESMKDAFEKIWKDLTPI